MLYLQINRPLHQQMPPKNKKLVAISATSTLITEKTEEKLEQIPCIWYPVTFKDWTEALLDSKKRNQCIELGFCFYARAQDPED